MSLNRPTVKETASFCSSFHVSQYHMLLGGVPPIMLRWLICLLFLFPLIKAHGRIQSPIPRDFTSKKPSNYGPDQHYPWIYDADSGIGTEAEGWSKGYLPCYNNKDISNVHQWNPGQTIQVTYKIKARHPGTCYFYLYKHWKQGQTKAIKTLHSYPCGDSTEENNSSFSLPNDIQDCKVAGDCFVQWFWKGEQKDQNYANCFDFVVGSGTTRRKCAGTTSL